MGSPSFPLDWLLRFRNDVHAESLPPEQFRKTNRGHSEGRPLAAATWDSCRFPNATADGQIIFSVGKDTLTANQILDLLERGELTPEGVTATSRSASLS